MDFKKSETVYKRIKVAMKSRGNCQYVDNPAIVYFVVEK